MTLGMFPDESRDALDALQRQGPGAPEQPGFFSGIPTALATGVAEGETKLGEVFAGASARGVRYAQHQGLTPGPWSEFVEQTGIDKIDPDELDARIRANSQAVLKSVRADPATIGYAGQVLHGLASVGVRAVAAGPTGVLGAATIAGGSEGYATSEGLQAQGVDKNTAHVLGTANALMTGAGLAMPGVSGVGKTLGTRLVSGAAVNALMGAADRATMHSVLADHGYDAMAAQYRVMDGQAMAVDAILGGVFGFHGYLRGKLAPSTIDAAHTANDALHVNNDLTPGAPVSPAELDVHTENMVRSAAALFSGDDPPQLRMPETVPNPAQDALRATNAAGVADAQAEALAEHGVATAAPETAREGERRQDSLDSARMSELRGKGLSNLTPPETTEYAALLERDRLAAKVGGRRMQGVLNDDAYAEMLSRGEAKPVQGFVDMDMLKALNDVYGHTTGDEAIRTLGETLAHYAGEGNVFRRSSSGAGDEFLVQSADQASHDAAIEVARRHLENHVLESVDTVGTVRQLKGIGFSHGSGKTAELAEQAAYVDKQLRKEQGLRSDRGAMDQKPSAPDRQPARDQATGAKAAGVKTPEQATSKLAEALKALKESNGKDANAHETARAILAHSADAGWDEAGIARAAVERAGPGAERALEAARVRDEAGTSTTAGLNADTRESVEQAQSAIERNPGLSIADPVTGVAVNANDALTQAVKDLSQAKNEGELAKIAAACFGRG